jgi:hypothetical protein
LYIGITKNDFAMLKFNEIKKGDYVIADMDGNKQVGMVTGLMPAEHDVCIDNGTQEFWFKPDQLSAVDITEGELERLKFNKQMNEHGSVKYMKGAFRMVIPKAGNFEAMEIWYRDERRHILQPIKLHQLQNHFYEMTKVHLDDSVM